MNAISLNNRFVVEAYLSDRQIKSTNHGGFAMIQQKVTLKGLRLLIDAKVDGLGSHTIKTAFVHSVPASESEEVAPRIVPKGSIAYIREEYLHTQPWAKQLLECEGIEGKFMIVDIQYVEFIDYK